VNEDAGWRRAGGFWRRRAIEDGAGGDGEKLHDGITIVCGGRKLQREGGMFFASRILRPAFPEHYGVFPHWCLCAANIAGAIARDWMGPRGRSSPHEQSLARGGNSR
jgi:hypothetical protein